MSDRATSSPGVRLFEVEQAAHALRHRLAIAASQSNSPSLSFIETFKEAIFRSATASTSASTPASTSASTSIQSSLSPSVSAGRSPLPDELNKEVQGLGLGIDRTDDDEEMKTERSGARDMSESSDSRRGSFAEIKRHEDAKIQPSLNDVLFRPMLGTSASSFPSLHGSEGLRGEKDNFANRQQDHPQKRSPHVRQGSSAFLEQVAMFSPQIGSDAFEAPSPRLLSSKDIRSSRRRSDAMSTPHMTSFYSPKAPQWSMDSVMAYDTPTLHSSASFRQHRRRLSSQQEDAHVHARAEDARAKSLHARKSSHQRGRSLGGANGVSLNGLGSMLPNGHPASSLAKDLGLANGGVRPSRSRNASAANESVSAEHAHEQHVHDPEVLAGMLLAGLSAKESTATSATSDHHESPSLSGTPRRASTFVDPNTVTPRKRQRSSFVTFDTPPSSLRHQRTFAPSGDSERRTEEGSNEAAAHSLLDLAASPSPLRDSSKAKFPGYTPSLRDDLLAMRRFSANGSTDTVNSFKGSPPSQKQPLPLAIKYRLMDDIDRHEADGQGGQGPRTPTKSALRSSSNQRGARGHARTGSLGSHGLSDSGSPFRLPSTRAGKLSASLHPSTPPRSEQRAHARTPSQSIGRVRLMSPPITPPGSDEVRARSKTEQGDRTGKLRTTSPDTPSRRRGSLRLVAEEEEEEGRKEQSNNSDDLPHQDTDSMDIGSNDLPKTPTKEERPLVPAEGAPRTPPPIARTPKTPKAPGSNFSYGEFLHVSPSPQPRMRTFSHHGASTGGGGDVEAPFVLRAGETPTRGTRGRARFLDFGNDGSSKQGINSIADFTVGPLLPTNSVKGLGLDGAFEETVDFAANEAPSADMETDDNVLVPGKRAAMVLQPSPPGGPKRMRSGASLNESITSKA